MGGRKGWQGYYYLKAASLVGHLVERWAVVMAVNLVVVLVDAMVVL